MKANVCRGLALAAIGIVCGIGNSVAWAQTINPSPSPNSTIPQSNPSPSPNLQSPQTETNPNSQIAPNSQIVPTAQQVLPTCPAGQFASAFPDVRPEDWAYEAVNRLASVPIRCFSTSAQ